MPDPDDTEQERVLLHMPVDVRSVSLAVLTVMVGLFAMHWAKNVLIPILLGMMVSYALTPVVDRLSRWHIPRGVSATLLLSAIVVGLAWGGWSLSDQANDFLDTLPKVAARARQWVQPSKASALGKVERAAAEIESVANAAAHGTTRAAPAAAPERPRIDVRGYLLSGTLGALTFLGQATIVFFIALFLLSTGNSFRRKVVKLAGPTLSQKKVTIETLDEIAAQIQRYLTVQLAVSALVGLLTGIAFYLLGLDQAAFWGVVAGATNLIPYVGALVIGAGAGTVAFAQFDSIQMALAVAGASFAIHGVVGNVLTPWWMGRAGRMSPFAVFVSVLLFGWLWGVAGLLLGVPILMGVKAVCDRVDDLKPVGELLSE